MLKYIIELKHKDTGETEEFGVEAPNASAALGKVSDGKARFPQPSAVDPNKLTIQSFLTNGNILLQE